MENVGCCCNFDSSNNNDSENEYEAPDIDFRATQHTTRPTTNFNLNGHELSRQETQYTTYLSQSSNYDVADDYIAQDIEFSSTTDTRLTTFNGLNGQNLSHQHTISTDRGDFSMTDNSIEVVNYCTPKDTLAL